MKKSKLPIILLMYIFMVSCNTESPKLIFKFSFSPTQQRLDGLGNLATLAAGHGGLSPSFNTMSAHYIELAPSAITQLGDGEVLYKAAETTAGGSTAIDFSKSTLAGNGDVFFEMPLKDIKPGVYEYLRVSLAYQNFDVNMRIDTDFVVSGVTVPIHGDYNATVAGFIGYNTYIENFLIKTKNVSVSANKLQGFWGFEYTIPEYGLVDFETGQAAAGATTVVNPLAATSPIPAGSCVVTAAFDGTKLSITGNEKEDIVINVSLSTNQSFEWVESIGGTDGKWEPLRGESITDMGIRGMIPYYE